MRVYVPMNSEAATFQKIKKRKISIRAEIENKNGGIKMKLATGNIL